MKATALLFSSLSFVLLAAAPAAQEQEQKRKPVRLLDVRTIPGLPWQLVEQQPDWFAQPPKVAGQFHFALVRRSNQGVLAEGRAAQLAEKDARRVLVEHLAPALGVADADAVVDVLCRHTVLAAAATTGTRKIAEARGPGQTIGEAFVLWRVPVRDAVCELDAGMQGRVERALLQPVVGWQDVQERPKWADEVEQVDGRFAFVSVCEDLREFDARLLSLTRGREEAKTLLRARLLPVLGEELTAACVERALARLMPARRAVWMQAPDRLRRRRTWTAIVRYEVPISAIVRDLDDEARTKVEAALKD